MVFNSKLSAATFHRWDIPAVHQDDQDHDYDHDHDHSSSRAFFARLYLNPDLSHVILHQTSLDGLSIHNTLWVLSFLGFSHLRFLIFIALSSYTVAGLLRSWSLAGARVFGWHFVSFIMAGPQPLFLF